MSDDTDNQALSPEEEARKKEDKALLTKLKARLDSCKESDKKYNEYAKKMRKYARGALGEDDSGKLVRANLIGSTINALLPHIYSKNPETAINPSPSVTEEVYPAVRQFSRTAEIVLNRQFRDARLKKKMKKLLRKALTVRTGFLKATYQREFDEDPIIRDRINDAQDNIKRIEMLVRDIDDPLHSQEVEAKRAELTHLLEALEQELEIVVAEGLRIDVVDRGRLHIDPSLDDPDNDLEQARWISEEIYMSREEAEERFNKRFPHANTYSDTTGVQETRGANDDLATDLLKIHEMWDKSTMTIYTWADGDECFARPPYQPKFMGERWYPYFNLVFYQVDESDPLSLVDLLMELQDEYNATRTQLAEHRKLSVPHYLAAKGTDTDTIERRSDAALGEIVLVETNGQPLNQVIEVAQTPPINPAVYDTTAIRLDMDQLSGLQDANRGGLMKAKTATEAEIMQSGMTGRTGEITDTIEDMFQELASYCLEVLLQELTPEKVLRIAGPDASWPEMQDKAETFNKVEIEIRAGTTGKPDKMMEQKRWLQLLPMLQQLGMQIKQLEMTGMDSTHLKRLLRETLRRFDERMDVEELLPQSDPNAAMMAMMGGGMPPAMGGQPGPGGLPMGPGGPAPIQ